MIHPRFLSKLTLVAAAVSATFLAPLAHGGVLHEDVSRVTYHDFGQNYGRYSVQNVNALLSKLTSKAAEGQESIVGISSSGGVYISYTGGQERWTMPQKMISYDSVVDGGWGAALGNNFVVTVAHNGENNASFTSRDLGENSIKYSGIGYRRNQTFSILGSGEDYKLTRMSKLITDVVPMEHTTEVYKNGELYYRAGSGSTCVFYEYEDGTSKRVNLSGYGITGAVMEGIAGNTLRGYFNFDWGKEGISDKKPLPFSGLGGDSGSPIFVWDETAQAYKYQGAAYGISGVGRTWNSTSAAWTTEKLQSFDVKVDFAKIKDGSEPNTVCIYAVDESNTSISGNGVVGRVWTGEIKDTTGTVLATYKGIHEKFETRKDLSEHKNKDNWYAFDDINATSAAAGTEDTLNEADLFNTQNLVFNASSADTHSIVLKESIDLGIGYMEFRANEQNEAKFNLSAENGHTLDSAGFLIGKDVDLTVSLVNSEANHMRQWNVIGEGKIHLSGTSKNEIFLNIGRGVTAYLENTGEYAAYNVLVNTGATVVIENQEQIARNLTFGAGGGTLDMNDNDMDWNNSANVSDKGFGITALTQDAVITNSKGNSTLTYTQAGENTFVGSFTDTENSSLKVIYSGAGTWTLNSIHTNLRNAASGLDVQSGKVILVGTTTKHAPGSLYSAADDWHYADATMNVVVKNNATFELGSHARLTGTVTVEDGGTYIMREGVKHQMEYIEGWYEKEDTYKIAEYYGHKGDISLEGETAKLQIDYSAGVTARNEYSGRISGSGSLSVNLGTNDATLILSGSNTGFTGSKTINAGNVLAKNNNALGDCASNKWLINEGGTLGVGGRSFDDTFLNGYIAKDSKGVLALTQDQVSILDLSSHKGLIIGAAKGHIVKYGSADESLTAYDHDSNESTNKAWVLGGGGGTLIVDAKLDREGANVDLILGNKYGRGEVKLTNTENSISNIVFTGQVTLDYEKVEVLGNATLDLGYTNRVYTYSSADNIADNSEGVLLIDKVSANQSFNLTNHTSLFLGSNSDTTLSGEISIATDTDYKFGGSTGKLTVTSSLKAGHGLVVDAQSYTGGEIHLVHRTKIDKDVIIQGHRSDGSGEITLSFGADNALTNATSVTVKKGGIIDLAGTTQTFKTNPPNTFMENNYGATALTVESGGSIIDSEGGGSLLISSGLIRGTAVLDKVTVDGEYNLDPDDISSAFLPYDETKFVGNVRIGELTLENGWLHLGQGGKFSSNVVDVLHYKGGQLSLNSGQFNIGTLNVYQGATLEMSTPGAQDFGNSVSNIVLAGGAISNSRSIKPYNDGSIYACPQLYHIVLAADSKVSSVKETGKGTDGFGLVGRDFAATEIDLAGHKLTKTGGADFYIYNTSITDGTIDVTEGALKFGDGGASHDSTIEADILLKNGGSFTVEKTGSGTLTFSGEQTNITSISVTNGTVEFSGKTATIVNGGDIKVGDRATLRLNEARLNIASGSITTSGGGIVSVTNGTIGILEKSWSSSANMKVSGNLTVDTGWADSGEEGSITLSGTITEAEDGTGRITKIGGGTLKLSGTTSVRDIVVQSGKLEMDKSDSVINVNIAQGAEVSITGGYTLDSEKSLTVIASNTSATGRAVMKNSIIINGGTMTFSGSVLDTTTAALTIDSLSVNNNTTLKLSFTEEGVLKTGITYKLVDKDWSSLSATISSVNLEYLTGTVTANESGLSIEFSAKEGSAIWDGTESDNQWTSERFGTNSTFVFNDIAENKEVQVVDAIDATGIIFDNAESYNLSGDSTITTTSLTVRSSSKATFNNSVNVNDKTIVEKGMLVVAKSATFNEVEVRKTGDLNVTGVATAASLELSDGATLSGTNTGSLTTSTLSFNAGSTVNIDGAQVKISNGVGFDNARLSDTADSVTTVNLTKDAVLDDRESYYRLVGILNINGDAESSGIMYIDGIRMADSEDANSTLNVGAGAHLVITGNKAMTNNNNEGAGSFSLSHWDAQSSVNIEGKLTSNAVISSWDSQNASVNVKGGGELNLLAGLTRNGTRDKSLIVNVESGGTLNAKGGTQGAGLDINLEAGATLGAIADETGGKATFTNNMNIGKDGFTGVVTFDTDVKTVEDYILRQGTGGNLILSGTTTIKGTPTIKIAGAGKLWLADGVKTETTTPKGISITKSGQDAQILGVKVLSRNEGVVSLSGAGDAFAEVCNASIDVMDASVLTLENVKLSGTTNFTGEVNVLAEASLQIASEGVSAETLTMQSGSKLVVDLADFSALISGKNEVGLTILSVDHLWLGEEKSPLSIMAMSRSALSAEPEYSALLSEYCLIEDSKNAYANYTKTWSYNESMLKLTLSIPEPSAFGLFAGLGALALVASRRRRK